MGVPIRKLICASNCNNVLTDFINTGIYDLRSRSLKVTTSPAIDILLSSNLERYLYHMSGGSSDFVRQCYDQLRREKIFQLPNEVIIDFNIDFYWKHPRNQKFAIILGSLITSIFHKLLIPLFIQIKNSQIMKILSMLVNFKDDLFFIQGSFSGTKSVPCRLVHGRRMWSRNSQDVHKPRYVWQGVQPKL